MKKNSLRDTDADILYFIYILYVTDISYLTGNGLYYWYFISE